MVVGGGVPQPSRPSPSPRRRERRRRVCVWREAGRAVRRDLTVGITSEILHVKHVNNFLCDVDLFFNKSVGQLLEWGARTCRVGSERRLKRALQWPHRDSGAGMGSGPPHRLSDGSQLLTCGWLLA
ncbi:unnamed protein product [Coccothraustes coccothraustes]